MNYRCIERTNNFLQTTNNKHDKRGSLNHTKKLVKSEIRVHNETKSGVIILLQITAVAICGEALPKESPLFTRGYAYMRGIRAFINFFFFLLLIPLAPGLMRGRVARSTGFCLILLGRNFNLVNLSSIDVLAYI